MSRGKPSISFRVVAYISIAVSTWMLIGTLFASIRYSPEIPVGALALAFAAILTLLMAGIFSLRSARAGLYLYSASSIIWLIRIVIQIAFGEKAPSMTLWIVFVRTGGIWLILCLVGIVVSYHGTRKSHKTARTDKTT